MGTPETAPRHKVAERPRKGTRTKTQIIGWRKQHTFLLYGLRANQEIKMEGIRANTSLNTSMEDKRKEKMEGSCGMGRKM